MPQGITTLADDRLLQRVHGEYMEMPGLRLTIPQACRLWNMDLTTSRVVLDHLVHEQFLRLSGPHYVRAATGRAYGRA